MPSQPEDGAVERCEVKRDVVPSEDCCLQVLYLFAGLERRADLRAAFCQALDYTALPREGK